MTLRSPWVNPGLTPTPNRGRPVYTAGQPNRPAFGPNVLGALGPVGTGGAAPSRGAPASPPAVPLAAPALGGSGGTVAGYGGVPVVISRPDAGAALAAAQGSGTGSAVSQLLALSQGSPDTGRLDAHLAAIGDQQNRAASNAVAAALSKAFASGAGGTAAQGYAQTGLADVMERFASQSTGAALDFYNQQAGRSLQAALGAGNLGIEQGRLGLAGQQLALSADQAIQQSLFAADQADLSRSGALFDQMIRGGQYEQSTLNNLFQQGDVLRALEQANIGSIGAGHQASQDRMLALVNALLGSARGGSAGGGGGTVGVGGAGSGGTDFLGGLGSAVSSGYDYLAGLFGG